MKKKTKKKRDLFESFQCETNLYFVNPCYEGKERKGGERRKRKKEERMSFLPFFFLLLSNVLQFLDYVFQHVVIL